ncbi:mediator of RNA polymerase II transcription subunit 8 [Yamadazyma tenuis]|uniref:Mediator of RNA polymerase II transcription subunit 8 n=1 Tax=Candida tenuis (strain ATCC 10573 / BCRC 21748 / CBS 615 / JCM 9827 / NBRC 10315 / NRRL Y-1498 / VKM Y-70) TaxID=590646 RepID=G3BB15_CANTC|nr:uncharacterized protein CANTEDRAFT_109230 [Yamadazyma tenuis ATCC 10573]EGV62121.1 hypothetical protein CANTEDRAFT_109230 [Yamadazyma tenuis ATCC 10573]WEJ93372.1 mediator of RNA polymerase II transcription subunit 8 [Yamadazyma tenuis]
MDSLEATRNRLNQVHISLRKLSDQINYNIRFTGKTRLPTYGQFQSQFHVLITQLHSITSILENNQDILDHTNAYPLPLFPTSQHEGLATTLLRKKPLPEVEKWIDEAIEHSKSLNINSQADDEFSQWCSAKIQEIKEDFQFYGFLSTEELEYLETEEGKKEASAKKEAERQREDVEMGVTTGKKALHPNQVLKFMCQGKIE